MTNQRKLPRINRKWWVAPAVLAAAAMTLATIAVASDDRVPTTKPLSGTYTLSPLDVRSRRCVGTDGIYVEASGTLAGRSTSSDPRFNGRFEAFIDRGFTNLTTGYGASRGHVTWFNASGKPTARASYREVISQASHATGIFFGHVFAVDGLPASEMFANYKVTFDSNLNAQAEYGGVGDSQTPAIVQSGGCGGDEQGDQAR